MLIATIAAEVAFWLCLVAGCLLRYVFNLRKLGLILMAATPIIDLLLLVFFYVSLSQGGKAEFMHGFAAFYIAFSVVFGKDIIGFVDRKVSGVAPRESAHADRRSFTKCVVASVGAALLLLIGIVVTGLAGSFWLVYWLIAVACTPAMWWGVQRWMSKKATR